MKRPSHPRLEELFEAAMDLTTGKRTAFLDEECAGEPSLRQQIEDLLQADGQPTGSLLEPKPIESAPDHALPTDRSAVSTITVGTTIGSYRIVEKLDEGGMGVIYVARHQELGKRVVIKVLRDSLTTSDDMGLRFMNEAKAAARIGHPGIVEVFDAGRHPSGDLYIIMELLPGESLKKRLKQVQKLPEEIAVSLVRQAARALAAAHHHGIVHRDLKPDNIFLVPDDEVAGGERVKLLDFGIAKLAEKPAGMATKTNLVMGTPPYMSPEQCRGAGQVDHRADLYSLGVILFEMLCGRRPFIRDGLGEYMIAHMSEPAPPVTRFNPEVSAPLATVIQRLLVKSPAQRLESADALVAALDDLATVPDGSDATRPLHMPTTSNGGEVVATTMRQAAAVVNEPERTLMARAWYWWPAGALIALAIAGVVLSAGHLGAGAWTGVHTGEPKPGAHERGRVADPSESPQPNAGVTATSDASDEAPWQRAFAELRELLDIAEPEVRIDVIRALEKVGAERSAPLFYRALNNGSQQVRLEAARALVALGWPDAAPKIRHAMRTSAGRLRVQLAACLMMLGDPDGKAILERELTTSGSLALDAAVALARSEKPAKSSHTRARRYLRNVLRQTPAGRERWYRAAAALVAVDNRRAELALHAELARPDPRRALAGAEILALHGADDAIDYLGRVSADPSFALRGEAALILARAGHTAALGFAGAALRPSESVDEPPRTNRGARRGVTIHERRLAALVAGRLAGAGGTAYADEVTRMAHSDDDRRVRIAARAALIAFADFGTE